MQDTEDFRMPGLGVGSVLSLAFAILRKHAVFFCVLVAIMSIPESLVAVYAEGNSALFISSGFAVLLGAVSEVVVCYAVYLSLMDRKVSLAECWAQIQPQLGAVCLATIVKTVGFAIGLIAFVVPGIYLLTILTFTVQACVMERLSADMALKRSVELCKGYFWNIFVIFLIADTLAIGASGAIQYIAVEMAEGNRTIELLGSVLASLPLVFIYVTAAVAYFKLLYIKATGMQERTARVFD